MLQYVKELAEIAHHSRDRGVQLWGRITGSPEDAETTQWFSGKTLKLDSAVAGRGAPGTSAATLDLEAVYVCLGTEADFVGRGVKGKAAFIYAEEFPGAWKTSGTSYGAGRRAEERGAAAVFLTMGIPGNFRTAVGAGSTRVPGFTLGFGTAQRCAS
jgi:hypothetical protein